MIDSSHFVWSEPRGDGRNRFVLFRRDLTLTAPAAVAQFHIFADTRYRLRVDDVVVGYGPARFHPSRPEADTYDLAPHLSTAGDHVITVEVHHRGAPSFDAHPSRGAFATAGTIDGVDLATLGSWQCRVCAAWDAQAPCFSFAQGPIEIVDTRALDPVWFAPGSGGDGWQTPVPVAEPEHWGRVEPRSIPLLDMAERPAVRVDLVATLAPELRVGFREDGVPSSTSTATTKGAARIVRRSIYAVCLHSPRAQAVTLGVFWGPHWLNGEAVAATNDPLRGNRQNATVTLRAGWNLLYGEPEAMTDAWPVLVALPADAGITPSASERLDDPAWMRRAGTVTDADIAALRREAPATYAALPAFAWRDVPRGHRPATPARDAGWDVPAEILPTPTTPEDIVLPADSLAVCDIGGEYHGHVVVEIDAPAGTTIDIAISERRRSDGFLALFQSNWTTNEAERFIVRGGPQRIEGFHPRGGRYVAVIARGAPVTVRRVAVRDTLYPQHGPGTFTCADETLTWMFATGRATLRACMEDAFVDCPWRERGAYVGDSLVQFHAARQLDADLALVKRTLRVFADCQRDDGLIKDMAPSWHDKPLLDYALLWITAVREVWTVDGDLAWVRSLWPHIQRVLASPGWVHSADGLIDTQPDQRVFLDWGIPKQARCGVSGPLNAIYAKTLADAADLARRLHDPQANVLAAQARTVHAAFLARFWEPATRRFRDHAEVDGPGWHTAAYALGFGLAPDEAVDAVVNALRHTSNDSLTGNRDSGKLDTYAFAFLIDGLSAHGHAAFAETLIPRAYARMQAAGAWTLWENFHGSNSLCHAWSCGPMRHCSERILGVRAVAPGEPDRIQIVPESALTQAAGVVPHRRGAISIRWWIADGQLHLHLRTPPGVVVERIAGGGPLAGIPLVLDHTVEAEIAGVIAT